MTTNYHTAIATGESNAPATINTRLATLDAQLVTQAAQIAALNISGVGSVYAQINNASGEGDTSWVVDNISGTFLAGATVVYTVDGVVYSSTVAANTSTSLLTVTAAPGVTIPDNTVISQVPAAIAGMVLDSMYNVKDPTFGAVGDGTTDDTAAIQAAIDAAEAAGGGMVVFPYSANAYMADPLTWKDNVSAWFYPGTTLKARTGFGANDRFININGISNVVIWGNHATIEMQGASEYTTGEQRHGVFIFNASNVSIYDLHSENTGGDGFYIGGTTHSENILLQNCYANANRRQGLSIVSAVNCLVKGGAYTNTSGTDPQYGIDIEPNTSANEARNIVLDGVLTQGNTGGGIIVALSNLVLTSDKYVSITIKDCTSIDDGGNAGDGAIRISGNQNDTWDNYAYGSVKVENCSLIQPYGSGLIISAWDADRAPRISVKGGYCLNANSGGAVNDRDKCGVIVFAGSGTTMDVGNFEIDGFKIYDNRGSVATYAACYIENNVAETNNWVIRDVEAVGFTPTVGRDFLQLGTSNNSVVEYTAPKVLSVSGNLSLRDYSGQTITPTADCTLTLPSANSVVGQHWIIRSRNFGSVLVSPQSTDTILEWGRDINNDVVLNKPGDYVKLRSIGDTYWQVEAISDRAKRPLGQSVPATQVWGTAAPTTGSWEAGDRVHNVAPAAGGMMGWVCTVRGTFGTLNGGATTGSATSGSPTLTVNDATGIRPGMWLTCSGAFSGAIVEAVSGTTITMGVNASGTVSGVAVSYFTPTFKPFGAVQGASAYTVTNGATDRSYDANSTTLDEVADVLGTLIGDLKTAGIIV